MQSEGDARRPSAEAKHRAALCLAWFVNLNQWITQTPDKEQLTLDVRTRCLLQDKHHIANRIPTMADVIVAHQKGAARPPPTMDHSSQWPYVADCFLADIRAYSPDGMN